MPTVRIKKLLPEAQTPQYAKAGDAGADLCSSIATVVEPGDSKMIPTGIAIELPKGYEAQVRPRSGLAYKNQVTVLNTPGTVDEGYRGEVGVILINHGTEPFSIKPGDRIAQLVIKPVEQAEFIVVEKLGVTERGVGGFGSTGK